MRNILTREEFLLRRNESFRTVTGQVSGQEDMDAVNEGLLTNLFGALLKKDMWGLVKGDESIKREFREIDEQLNGFYLTKVKNPNASQNVRQTLVNWAGDIYNAKVKEMEGVKDLDKAGKEYIEKLLSVMSFADKDEKTLESEITDKKLLNKIDKMKKSKGEEIKKLNNEVKKVNDKYQKELDELTSSSPDLKRWANILKSRMMDIIDRLLDGKYDEDKKLAKDLEEAQKRKDEKMKKNNDEEAKKENEQLKKISDERTSVLKKCGVDVVGDSVKGKDFLKQVTDELTRNKLFESLLLEKKISIEDYSKTKLPKLIGLNVEADKDGEDKNTVTLNKVLKTLTNVVFKTVGDSFKKTFDLISGVNLQAMTVAYSNLLFACYMEKKELVTDDMITLMARCAIYNNTVVGFGLPCPDEDENKKDEEKNSMFGYYSNQLLAYLQKQKKGGLPVFKSLCDPNSGEIVKRAKKLIDDYNKEQEQELKKEEQEQKKEEGK